MSKEEEIQTYGEPIDFMIDMRPPEHLISNCLYAMQILSDAQAVLKRGEPKLANQFINKAKYFLSLDVEREYLAKGYQSEP